jgi:hypothetical protein
MTTATAIAVNAWPRGGYCRGDRQHARMVRFRRLRLFRLDDFQAVLSIKRSARLDACDLCGIRGRHS